MGKVSRRIAAMVEAQSPADTELRLGELELSHDSAGIMEAVARFHLKLDQIMRSELGAALKAPNVNDKTLLLAQLNIVSGIKENLEAYPLTLKYWSHYWRQLGKRKISQAQDENKNLLAPESVARTKKIIETIRMVHDVR